MSELQQEPPLEAGPLLERLAKAIVEAGPPALVKRLGEVREVTYLLAPLEAVFLARGKEVELKHVACDLKAGVFEVLQADGSLLVKAPGRAFTIDRILHPQVHETIMGDFRKLLAQAEEVVK